MILQRMTFVRVIASEDTAIRNIQEQKRRTDYFVTKVARNDKAGDDDNIAPVYI